MPTRSSSPKSIRPARRRLPGIDRDHFVLGLRAHGHREVIPLPNAGELAGVVHGHCRQRRFRRLSRRRQHHAMGLRAAGRIEGAGVSGRWHACLPRHHARSQSRDAANCAGGLLANQSLAELTWFRVGGPAQVLFTPADEDDLAYFLAHLPQELAGLCRRRRLQSDRARWRHAGRGDPACRRAASARPAPTAISSAPALPRSTSAWPRRRRRPISAGWNSSSAFPAPSAARCA